MKLRAKKIKKKCLWENNEDIRMKMAELFLVAQSCCFLPPPKMAVKQIFISMKFLDGIVSKKQLTDLTKADFIYIFCG